MKSQPGEARLALRARWKGVAGARKGAVISLIAAAGVLLMLLVYGIGSSGRSPTTATAADTAPPGAGGGGEWISQVPDTPRGGAAQTPPIPPPLPLQEKKYSPADTPPPPKLPGGPVTSTGGARSAPTPEEQYQLEVEKRKREALQAALIASPVGGAIGGGRRDSQQGADSADSSALLAAGRGQRGEFSQRVPEDEAQNRQAEKAAFLKAAEARTPGYLDEARTAPLSQYEVKAGSIIPAVLISGINSDLPGAVVAQVRETVYDYVSARHVLIPQGSRLVGRYDSQVAYGQERALVIWERILFPDGSSLTLKGMPGTDSIGRAGAEDQVNNHYGKLFVGVVLSSILSIGTQVAAGGSNVNNSNPSVAQLSVEGVAGNANQVGQQITRKNLNVQPTLVIRPGYLFNVLVSRDLVLPVYASGTR